jgi:hypothetical protein
MINTQILKVMKKLILLATVILAISYQTTKAQVSFDLNISSGPRYAPAYYQPVEYYAPARPVYYRERVIVNRPVVYHRTRYVASPRYYGNRYDRHYYKKSYYKGHGKGHGRGHGRH